MTLIDSQHKKLPCPVVDEKHAVTEADFRVRIREYERAGKKGTKPKANASVSQTLACFCMQQFCLNVQVVKGCLQCQAIGGCRELLGGQVDDSRLYNQSAGVGGFWLWCRR